VHLRIVTSSDILPSGGQILAAEIYHLVLLYRETLYLAGIEMPEL